MSDASTDAGARVIEASAHAKVNLVLAVGQRQPTGYHELVSVVQRFDVADHMRIAVAPAEQASVQVIAEGLREGDTLVTRALELLLEVTASRVQVYVELDKQIPVGAGLGGGSSDAGTALLAVNAALEQPLSPQALLVIAAEVGSDVPFFASGAPAAIIAGRGEQVHVVPGRLPVPPVVLVWPGVEQSTAEVYRSFEPHGRPLPTIAEAGAAAIGGSWFNDLAHAARRANELVAETLEIVQQAGAGTLVAGSGASVVAVPAAYDAVAVDELAAELRDRTAHMPGAWVRVAPPRAGMNSR